MNDYERQNAMTFYKIGTQWQTKAQYVHLFVKIAMQRAVMMDY
jgi:hypothetical protein